MEDEFGDPNTYAVAVYYPRNEDEADAERNEETDAEINENMEYEEYEMMRLMDEFRDEPSIRHNVCPESDSDEEGDGAGQKNAEKDDMGRGPGFFEKGMSFFNDVAFKEAVVDYVLRTGRNLKQFRYDTTRCAFKCVGGRGCEWRIICAVTSKGSGWKVTQLQKVHNCIPNGQCEMFKVPVIARLFLDKIRQEPEYYLPMKMREIIKEKWKLQPSRPQCQADRNKALKWLQREYDSQFARLRDYAAEIVVSNPMSTVDIDTVTNEAGLDVFKRVYVCFASIKTTWKETCRPLIGVDGCFLKSKMKGELLVAMGRDADNRIYPIAWGVVSVENYDNWAWFMEKLRDDLELMDGDGFVMISDRQKGLIKAAALVLPRIEHRACVRHIYGNLKKKHGKKPWMKPLIWNLAWSYNEAEYAANLERIENYDKNVYASVLAENPRSWCRAFYRLGSFCEDVENNSTESFNTSIAKSRTKPLVPMLETIRRLAMVRIDTRSVASNGHNGLCTPYVISYLSSKHKKAAECMVFASTNGLFEVECLGSSYRVSMDRRTCTCRAFDISGIPCVHAYGVILHKKLLVEAYVCQWFQTSMWRRNYANGIVPLRGQQFWPSTHEPDVHAPTPQAMPGRPKNRNSKDKRKRGSNESPQRRKSRALKRVMHCGVCGAANHNARYHKTDSGSQIQPSQSEPSHGIMTQLH